MGPSAEKVVPAAKEERTVVANRVDKNLSFGVLKTCMDVLLVVGTKQICTMSKADHRAKSELKNSIVLIDVMNSCEKRHK
jgi:hypothetical protein